MCMAQAAPRIQVSIQFQALFTVQEVLEADAPNQTYLTTTTLFLQLEQQAQYLFGGDINEIRITE